MSHSGSGIGLVLRTKNYQDKDRWITILTSGEGRQDFLAKGVRSLTSRRRAILQTGSVVKFSWVGKGETKLLTEAVAEDTLLPTNPTLPTIRDFSAILEILYHIALADQAQEELYEHALALLKYMRDQEGEYHRGVVRQRLLDMLYEQGIAVPEEMKNATVAEVFQNVVGRSVKSFTFLS